MIKNSSRGGIEPPETIPGPPSYRGPRTVKPKPIFTKNYFDCLSS